MNRVTTRLSSQRRALAPLAALAVGLVCASGSALAAVPVDAAPSVKVLYGDLNLASGAGNSALYARIVAAARRVCDVDRVDIRDLARSSQARSCEARAIAEAVQAVHSPQLAAIHDGRQPRG